MKKRISVTVEPDVIDRIKIAAKKESRSVSSMVEMILRAFLVFKKKKV